MTWTFVLWAILVGGPLLGIIATVALAVYHEHGEPAGHTAPGKEPARIPVLPAPPLVVRRASTTLLEDYLLDEREASVAVRRQRHTKLLLQTARASTDVFEDFIEDRAVPAVAPAPVARPLPEARPALQPVRRAPARVPVRAALERAPRPTRLVPLSPEIAIG